MNIEPVMIFWCLIMIVIEAPPQTMADRYTWWINDTAAINRSSSELRQLLRHCWGTSRTQSSPLLLCSSNIRTNDFYFFKNQHQMTCLCVHTSFIASRLCLSLKLQQFVGRLKDESISVFIWFWRLWTLVCVPLFSKLTAMLFPHQPLPPSSPLSHNANLFSRASPHSRSLQQWTSYQPPHSGCQEVKRQFFFSLILPTVFGLARPPSPPPPRCFSDPLIPSRSRKRPWTPQGGSSRLSEVWEKRWPGVCSPTPAALDGMSEESKRKKVFS